MRDLLFSLSGVPGANNSRFLASLVMTTTQTKDLAGPIAGLPFLFQPAPAGPLLVMTISEASIPNDLHHLTTDAFGSTLDRNWGQVAVKRLRWMLVLFLLGAAVCMSAVPLEDLPETEFNEVDAPVNLAPPVVPRIKFTRPAGDPIILPRLRLYCAGRRVRSLVLELAPKLTQRHLHSLQDLLSTFRI